MRTRLAIAFVVLLTAARGTDAQGLSVRGFADAGFTAFSAQDSFETILGSRTGTVFGGGAEVLIRRSVFVHVRASRFSGEGRRVFVLGEEIFELGVDTKVRVTPIELTGGYRFGAGRWPVIPYAGGGIGWHRFEETSAFADDDENVRDTHVGYQLLGGAEVPVARWAAIAGEAHWATVPDALGGDPNGVSALFDETNLGGFTLRVKLVIGR